MIFLYLFFLYSIVYYIYVHTFIYIYMCIGFNFEFYWIKEKHTVDHVPTLHCGGGNVVGATFDSSSQRGISQTSEVGRILGSTQAPSAILIINDAVISCTHSMLLERVPLPQVTEQRLHGPALHLCQIYSNN